MKNIPVRLSSFEGPLDLLCHLIEKNKINIYDIPIFEICEQFLEFIFDEKNRNAENISDFLVMASTLLEIKSRMLLPKEENSEGETEDPREELVRRIIEYKKFKEITPVLEESRKSAEQIFYKDIGFDIELLKTETEKTPEAFLDGVTPLDILNAFKNVLSRKEKITDTVRSGFKSIKKDRFTLEERSEYIKSLLKIRPKFSFSGLFDDATTKTEKIVTFLSVLELIKGRFINIRQSDIFGEITIERA